MAALERKLAGTEILEARAVLEVEPQFVPKKTWLVRYAEEPRAAAAYDDLMSRLDYAKLPRKLTRDEMNER